MSVKIRLKSSLNEGRGLATMEGDVLGPQTLILLADKVESVLSSVSLQLPFVITFKILFLVVKRV